ncbi:MAG: DUF721 domain-containing protein [Labilithrix sp.]|nr:DUF721 domain-containing protein [Labilithrix sp.]MCW5813624.1 DUF721 domain-containing protein [Labilithrix sp.]
MGRGKRWARRRLSAPESLEEVLDRAGENRFAKRQLPIPLARWRAAVGPRIADRARPMELVRGVLVVKVATSVWANELAMLAPQIVSKLVQDLGLDIKSLRFRVGPLDVVEGMKETRVYRKVPPPVPLPTDLAKTIANVEDDELRAVIESAARMNLAWQTPPATSKPPASAAPQGARGPRDAGRGSAPPGYSGAGSGAASRRTRGGD